MKIPASSFDVNLNDLLNRLNHNNGLANANAAYKQAMAKVKPQIDATNRSISQKEQELRDMNTATSDKNIKYVDDQRKKTKDEIAQARKDLTDFANGKKYESTQELNAQYDKLWGHLVINGKKINNPQDLIDAEQAEEKSLHDDFKKNIQAANNFTQSVIDSDMPKYVQAQMQAMQDSFPKNQVKYYPPGQFPDPSVSSPGDICWQSGNFNGEQITAQAYVYDGFHWNKARTTGTLYSANIFSPNIHGGNITGAEFTSENHNITGQANFHVNPKGDIYAHNFTMDLLNDSPGTSVNRMFYNTQKEAGGLSLAHGTLKMTALAHQDTGTPIKDYAQDFRANTFLEPDYLKLRTLKDTGDKGQDGIPGDGNLLGRTDIRGGNIEISDRWSQDTGIRLGYWNDQWALNDPLIVIGDYNRSDDYTALGSTGVISQNVTTNSIMLNNYPLSVIGGKLHVNHKRVGDPFDPSNLNREISHIKYDGVDDIGSLSSHHSSLNDHEGRLQHHRRRLDKHKDILKNRKGDRLDKDHNMFVDFDDDLTSYYDTLNDVKVQITSDQSTMNNINGTLQYHATLIDNNGNAIQQTKSDIESEISSYEQEVTNFGNQLDDVNNQAKTTVDNEVSTLNSQLEGQFLSQAAYAADKQQNKNDMDSWAADIRQSVANLPETVGDVSAELTNIRTVILPGCDLGMDGQDMWANTGSGAVHFAMPGGGWVNINAATVYAQGWGKNSDRSIKTNIQPVNSKNALSQVLNMDIKRWDYKSDNQRTHTNIGPIIDDLHNRQHQDYYTPSELIDTRPGGEHSFMLDNAVSYLVLSVQELEKQNSQQAERIAKLEFNNK